MNSAVDLKELYRRTVLTHSRHPHHFGRLAGADKSATGHNPLCGDKCVVYLRIDNGNLQDVAFEGAGCAICMASASIMTDAVMGQPLADAEKTAADVLLAFDRNPPADSPVLHGEMAALGGVRDFPTRIRCATLPWQTLRAALQDTGETVTTEASN